MPVPHIDAGTSWPMQMTVGDWDSLIEHLDADRLRLISIITGDLPEPEGFDAADADRTAEWLGKVILLLRIQRPKRSILDLKGILP